MHRDSVTLIRARKPTYVSTVEQASSTLGAFSVSLAVKDIVTSIDFYEKLGFNTSGGDGENWAILKNGATTIGLFQGMFDDNILTFNPGWSAAAQELDSFADIREVKSSLEGHGIEIRDDSTEDSTSGPASFAIVDPDGNAILIDQHV